MLNHRQLQILLGGITDLTPVRGSTHTYYRYPARFSPTFARAAIEVLTRPGDLVLDPFAGGGTTLVEAAVAGRRSIGADISALSTFICRVKTTPLSEHDTGKLLAWFERTSKEAKVFSTAPSETLAQRRQQSVQPIGGTAWPIRRVIEAFLTRLYRLEKTRQRDFARAVVLSSGQWALDNRRQLPSAAALRRHIGKAAYTMLGAALEYSRELSAHAATRTARSEFIPRVLQCSAAQLAAQPSLKGIPPPRLILTSPPYPGVHVLYHRWQVKGRRETAAPFWIAGTPDGKTAAHYTLGSRETTENYFNQLQDCFSGIVPLASRDTVFVQLIGFSDPDAQLPEFLSALRAAGLQEFRVASIANSADGRIWHIYV